jgi:hypothetical protein
MSLASAKKPSRSVTRILSSNWAAYIGSPLLFELPYSLHLSELLSTVQMVGSWENCTDSYAVK